MTPHARNRVVVAAASAAIVVGIYFLQARVGYNLWDEGFLWYGAQRVLAGEVPLRDFMAYDPGRYLWSAAFMAAVGDAGVVSLRVSVLLFQGIGIYVALSLLARSATRPGLLPWVLATASLVVWMLPRHKIFDIVVSLVLIAVLARVVAAPSARRFWIAGIAVGVAAIFGRNHGVYGVAGTLGVIAYLAVDKEERSRLGFHVGCFCLGVATGYLPMLAGLASVPGFAAAFVDGIRFILESGETNLPLPVPWPWGAAASSLPMLEAVRQFVVGMFFLAIVAWPVLGSIALVYRRRRGQPSDPVVVACVFVGFPYAHFALSRADLGHLAQGIFPFLVGAFTLMYAWASKAMDAGRSALPLTGVAGLIAGASFLAALPGHPAWQCLVMYQCVETKVGKDRLRVDSFTSADIALLGSLVERYASGGRAFLATPFWPGAYPPFERRSPMWANYALWKRGPQFERAEIMRIQAADPAFVLVFDLPLDGREELRFTRTHPLVDAWIRDNFVPVPNLTQNPAYRIYRNANAVP